MNKKGFAERPGAQDRVEFGVSVGWGGNRRKKEKARGGSGKQAGSWDSEETHSRACRMFVVPSTKPRPAWVLHTCQVEEPGALADPERG